MDEKEAGAATRKGDVTQLLQLQKAGSDRALEELIELVYDELCQVAHRQMRRERAGHTLNTRALVNEAYLRLSAMDRFGWKNRGHFFGIAGRAMKQILIQHARGKAALKRGNRAEAVSLDDIELLTEAQAESLLIVDSALGELEALSPRYRQVVEHRVFTGLSLDEAAEAMGVSRATAKRDWAFARAWLNQQIESGSPLPD